MHDIYDMTLLILQKNICRTHILFRTSIWDKGSERPKQPLKNNEYYSALQHNMGFNQNLNDKLLLNLIMKDKV